MRGSLIKPGTTPPHAAAHETGKDGIDARRIGAVPLHTLDGDKTIYVAKSGSDETGDGSEAKPFASIQKAVDTIAPGVWVGGNVNISIEAGEYGEDVVIEGFKSTNGYLQLNRARNAVAVHSIEIRGSDEVHMSGFTIHHIDNTCDGIILKNSRVRILYTNITKPSTTEFAYIGRVCIRTLGNVAVTIMDCKLQGGAAGINSHESYSTVHRTQISGSEYGIAVFGGWFINGYNNVNTSSTQRYIESGAQIIELSN